MANNRMYLVSWGAWALAYITVGFFLLSWIDRRVSGRLFRWIDDAPRPSRLPRWHLLPMLTVIAWPAISAYYVCIGCPKDEDVA